jgi:quercetin dioxygenase-like cupin family protein
MRVHRISFFATTALLAIVAAPLTHAQGTAPTLPPAEQKKSTIGDPNRVVQILQEPRHRQVHRDGDIYVLDIQINPGDMTLQHTHDAAILYTFISSGTGPSGGRLNSNTDYVTKNFTHQVGNEGPGLFRIIALTNYGPPVQDLKGDRPTGLTVEPDVENPWLRGYAITLAPGASTPMQMHRNPSLIVQTGDGLLHVTREDGITAELAAMGNWAWRNANSTYQVRNVGKTTVKFTLSEARRSN